MSDLQFTGTGADRTANPQSADDATDSGFDALIDLLASDDIHDIAGADSHPSRNPHAVQLRDACGKLAFDKIRLMFATQNLGPDRIDHNKTPDTCPDTYNLCAQPHGSDIQDILSRSGLSRSVSPSSQSSEQRLQGSRPASASSSAPLDQIIQSTGMQTRHPSSSARTSHISSSDELARIKSDKEFLPSRDQPNVQITIMNSMPRDKIPLLHRGSSAEKATTRPAETAPLTEPSPLHAGRVQDLTKPFEFEQLNGALSRATSEIHSLRERYETLRAVVTERLSPPSGLQTGKPSARPSGNHTIPLSHAHTQRGLESGQLDEISSLSEYEAKNILTGLIASLRLSPGSIMNLVSKFPDDPVTPHPSSLDDIRTSMEFLARVDELVWKRSVLATSDGPDLLYSRANTDALIARLALWEKTIRGCHKS